MAKMQAEQVPNEVQRRSLRKPRLKASGTEVLGTLGE
jgi:hypothetical protein